MPPGPQERDSRAARGAPAGLATRAGGSQESGFVTETSSTRNGPFRSRDACSHSAGPEEASDACAVSRCAST